MVKQTTDKSTKHRIFSYKDASTVYERHHPVPVKKMDLRDLSNEPGKTMKRIVSSLQSSEEATNSEPLKMAGTKRQQAECSSNSLNHQTQSTNVSPGHLVYVRRKFDTSSNGDAARVQTLRNSSIELTDKMETQKHLPENSKKDERKVLGDYWTQRFNLLQEYLQNLEQNGLKHYTDKFRASSSEDLNKMAVELKERAIRLHVEEALESQRVKDINFLGGDSQ